MHMHKIVFHYKIKLLYKCLAKCNGLLIEPCYFYQVFMRQISTYYYVSNHAQSYASLKLTYRIHACMYKTSFLWSQLCFASLLLFQHLDSNLL